MVDQVLASCYASFDHDLAHWLMTPMQLFPEIIEWIFGVNNGSTGYVKIAKEFGRMILPYGILYDKAYAVIIFEKAQYRIICYVIIFFSCILSQTQVTNYK